MRPRRGRETRVTSSAISHLVGSEDQAPSAELRDARGGGLEDAEAARVAPLEVVDRHHDAGGFEQTQRGLVDQDAPALRIGRDLRGAFELG